MKKKLILAVVALALVAAIAVPSAFAAVSDAQKQTILDNFNKVFEAQKKLVQTYIDTGLVTQEQGDLMLQNMELRNQHKIDAVNSGSFAPGTGYFVGGFGGGCGFRGGMGRGFGGGFSGGFGAGAAARI